MFKKPFTLLLFCLLCAAASADDFVERLDYCYPRYDWRGAIAVVLEDPERSQAAIAELREMAEQSDRQRKYDLNFYARFIERVLFLKAGGPDPNHKDTAWSGTPIEPTPDQIDIEAESRKAREYWNKAGLALQLGAHRATENWLKEAVVASHKIAWAGGEVPPDLLNLQKRYRLYLMGATDTGYIHPKSADYVLVGEMQRGEEESALLGLMAFVQAGRLAFDPEMVDKYLPELLKRAKGPTLFAARTFQAERRLQQEELSWKDFRSLHEATWKLYDASPTASQDPVLAPLQERWRGEAAEIWLDELERRVQSGQSEAADMLAGDLRRLSQGPHAWLEARNLLHQADHQLLLGHPDKAVALVDRADQVIASLERTDEQRFWELQSQEKYPQRPSVTTIGKLEALSLRARLEHLLAQPEDEIDKPLLLKAHAILDDLRNRVYLYDDEIGLLNAMLRYHFLRKKRNEVPPITTEVSLRFDTIAAPVYYADPIMKAEVMTYRALLMDHDETKRARKLLEEAVSTVESYLEVSRSSPARVRRIRARARKSYEALAEVLLRTGENEKAMDVLSRLAQVQSQDVTQEAVTRNLDEKASATLEQIARLERKTSRLEAQEVQTSTSSAVTKQEDSKVVSELLADTRTRYYETLKTLQKQEPDFSRLAIRPLNFARLQRAIPEDATVVQYFPSETQLYIFVASRSDLKVRAVPVSRQELERMVYRALRGLARGGKSTSGRRETDGELAALGKTLILPIRQDLGDRKLLAVIPAGAMSYLPFSALVTSSEGEPTRYLVQDFQTATILKAVDLDGLLSPPPASQGGLVGVGNPDGTLLAAATEVQAIGKLFSKSKLLLLTEATRSKLQQLCATQPAYLHIATHGEVNPHDPLESYLVMSDGPLTLADITSFELGSPTLVTLSACQTGIGEFRSEPGQDLTTLAEAFWFAGGRSLLASMWEVSDESTAALMIEFYRRLQDDANKAQALQSAQLALLAKEETAPPYHWAPFVLIGDWR